VKLNLLFFFLTRNYTTLFK